MFFWRSKFRKVTEQIEAGKLSEASALFLQTHLYEFSGGAELAGRLANQLLARARCKASADDFLAAWQDLNHADRMFELANSACPPQLLQQRQQLLELAIESAESHLASGRPVQALRIVADLKRQRILDSRADQIESLANRIHHAELLVGQGQWANAQQLLEKVVAQRPDLVWVQSRKLAISQQSATVGGLKDQLQSALQESHWTTARKVSTQLLDISPHYQLAADALRRSLERKQTSPKVEPAASEVPSLRDTSAGKLSETDAKLFRAARTKMNRVMLWVDGVGGFLLCLDPQVTLGRALPDAGIEVPIIGDLRRRHLRITRSGNDYLATALADVSIAGKSIGDPHLLQNNQQLTLGSTVAVKFCMPHPLSASARLDVSSRHRTQPWSDAIILVADTIILGPGKTSHIVCPEMEREMILSWSQNGWMARFGGNIEVDGRVSSNQAELTEHCRISGDGFSMTLETV